MVSKTYQAKDRDGNPIGPVQTFTAETYEELADKLAIAHENASAALYESRRAQKLGTLMEPDPEEPMPTFEPEPLTADERVKLAKELTNPETMLQAQERLDRARFGATAEQIRANLQETEMTRRVSKMRQEVDTFKAAHPEYIPSEKNRDLLVKWLTKRNYALTAKNLELAYDDLRSDPSTMNLLEIKPAQSTSAASTLAANETPASTNAGQEPTPTTAIPSEATSTAAANSASKKETPVQVKQSSSGLSSRGGASPNANATSGGTETEGITLRDIARMPATVYAEKLRDPKFRAQVDKLYADAEKAKLAAQQ